MKKFMMVFFFLCLGILFSFSVQASNKITLKNDKMVTKNGWAVYQIKVDNQLAFCLEPGVVSGTSSYQKQDFNKTYKKLSKTKKDKIKKIALFSEYLYKQNKKTSKNYYKYYYAGSELIWEVVSGKKYRFRQDLTSYRNKINKEVNDFNKFSKINKQTLTLKYGQNYVDNSAYYQYISLDDVTAFEKQAQMQVTLSNKQLSIQNNNNQDDKTYTLPYHKYAKIFSQGVSYAYYNAYMQDYALIKDDVKLTGYIKVKSVKETGSLKLLKKNEINEPLAGVTFQLYDDQMQKISLHKTGRDGLLKITNLKYGKYYLKELKTKLGYVLNKKLIVFNINTNKELVLPDLINYYQKSHLTIYKKDHDNGEPIRQTQFKIAGLKSIYTTDETGKIELALDNKCYQVKEVQASPSYRLDKKSRKVCLNQGEHTFMTLTNKRKKMVKTGNNYLHLSIVCGLLALVIIGISEANQKNW